MICICCGGKISGFSGGICNGCAGRPTDRTAPPARACVHTVPVTVPGWPS